MPIDVMTAKKAIRKLTAQRGWKDLEDAGKSILAETLASCSATEQHALNIVEAWGESSEYLPTPGQLKELARETPAHRRDAYTAHRNCPICGGTGRESFWGIATREVWPNGNFKRFRITRLDCPLSRQPSVLPDDHDRTNQIAMFSGFCRCEYGQHLRAVQQAAHDAA